jgi:hypothetical protein
MHRAHEEGARGRPGEEERVIRSRSVRNNATTARAVVAFFLLASNYAMAADNRAPISIGPLRVGMSAAEVRAATPGATWTENENTLVASAVMSLGGVPYDARVVSGVRGAYELVLHRKVAARTARACAKLYEGMLIDLESRLGPFFGMRPGYRSNSFLVGHGEATKSQYRPIGKASGYYWHSSPRYSEGDAHFLNATARMWMVGQFFVASPLFGDSACVTSFSITTEARPPEFEEISFAALKVLRTPSLGTLHNSLEGAVLPPEGLTLSLRCQVIRNLGILRSCKHADDTLPTPTKNAAFWRYDEMVFSTENLDPANKLPLFTALELRLEPAERFNLAAKKPVDARTIEWRDAKDELHKPAPDLRSTNTINTSAPEPMYDTATVTATCQIQPDESLACLPYETVYGKGVLIDDYNIGRFKYQAIEQLRGRRAAARTKAGKPTAGLWVRLELPLKARRSSPEIRAEDRRKYKEELERQKEEERQHRANRKPVQYD